MFNSGIILKSLRENEEKCTVLHAIKCHVSHNTFIWCCLRRRLRLHVYNLHSLAS